MHTAAPASTQGLLLSLSSMLPRSSPLRRQAHRVCQKLNRRHARAVDATAAEILARLLDATDTPAFADYESDGVLDRQFDDL